MIVSPAAIDITRRGSPYRPAPRPGLQVPPTLQETRRSGGILVQNQVTPDLLISCDPSRQPRSRSRLHGSPVRPPPRPGWQVPPTLQETRRSGATLYRTQVTPDLLISCDRLGSRDRDHASWKSGPSSSADARIAGAPEQSQEIRRPGVIFVQNQVPPDLLISCDRPGSRYFGSPMTRNDSAGPTAVKVSPLSVPIVAV